GGSGGREGICGGESGGPNDGGVREVKQAMIDGRIGRDPENANKRFSKAEALRMWRVLDEQNAKERLRKMVEETPDNYRLITDEVRVEWMLSDLLSEELIVLDVESTRDDVCRSH